MWRKRNKWCIWKLECVVCQSKSSHVRQDWGRQRECYSKLCISNFYAKIPILIYFDIFMEKTQFWAKDFNVWQFLIKKSSVFRVARRVSVDQKEVPSSCLYTALVEEDSPLRLTAKLWNTLPTLRTITATTRYILILKISTLSTWYPFALESHLEKSETWQPLPGSWRVYGYWYMR